jgi:hypothetical protein
MLRWFERWKSAVNMKRERYTGEMLREIRKRKGVGRPPIVHQRRGDFINAGRWENGRWFILAGKLRLDDVRLSWVADESYGHFTFKET